MGKYTVFFDGFVTSTGTKTAFDLWADAAGEYGEIVELAMTGAGNAASTDIMHSALAIRASTASTGTGTSQTPEPWDGKSAASLMAATVKFSAEPTTYATVPMMFWGFNQRGGMRWAVPRGEGMFVRNADTNKVFGLRVLSSTAGAVDGMGVWWEP